MLNIRIIKTPVIIPAFNEEHHIGATLDASPADKTEPIVVVNGSTDNTARIAHIFGVEVIELEAQGKLPAIQTALRFLGENALNPVLILDADTRPVMPKAWHAGMVRSLVTDTLPKAVGGPVWFTEGDLLNRVLRSFRRATKALETRSGDDINRVSQCGPNMGIHLKKNQVLEEVLSLPHYWPSEDRAMIATIKAHGGSFTQSISPALFTITPLSDAFTSLAEHRRLGPIESRRRTFETYAQRGAPGSVPYMTE